MMTSAEVVHRKCSRHVLAFGSGSFITKEVALFALRVALEDLEEVWQDEYANLERRVVRGQEELASQVAELMRRQETIETLRAGLQQVMIENDALEAECLRLRGMNGSSLATSVEMGLQELAVSSTSIPMGRMRRLPVESSGENGENGERVLSVRTLRRRKKAMEMQAKPVDDGDGDFFDWATALAVVLSPEQISRLEMGSSHWGDLLPAVQSRVVLRIAEMMQAKLNTISQTIYNRHKPHWASVVGSWTKTTDLTWQDVLTHLHVQPSNLPLASRIVRSAMS